MTAGFLLETRQLEPRCVTATVVIMPRVQIHSPSFFFLIISYHCWSFGLRGFTSRIFPKKIIIRCISQMSLELVKSRDITTKPSAITRTFHSRTSTKLRGKLVPRNIIKVCTQTQSYRGPKGTTIIPDVPLGDSFNFITMATRLSILVIVNVTKGESVT